jgi:hypothetical protein
VLGQKPDLFELLEELPVSRYLKTLSHRVYQLSKKLNRSAYFDQYAGQSVPYNYSLLWGPITMQTPRRVGTTGFLGLAPLITPETFILPRNGNVLTGRDGAFMWHATNMSTWISWTRTGQVAGATVNGPVDSRPAGDIFSSVVDANGGAQPLMNLSDIGWGNNAIGEGIDAPAVYFEIDLYDKKRGRSITGGRVPAETYFGGTLGAKEHSLDGDAYRWEPDTEIEPRLYVNQARVPMFEPTGGIYDQNDAFFNAQRVAFYVTMTFKGELLLEERPND